METYESTDYAMNPNSVEAFTEAIRAHFPGLVDIAFDGEIQQTSDETLMTFNAAGFRVHLDNGASFNITIQQCDYAEESEAQS